MKRILMAGLTPPVEGGSERHIYELSERLENTEVLTQANSTCKNKISIPIIKKPAFLRNISFMISSFIFSLFLLFTLRKKYDIIHIHENLLYFLAIFLKLRYKIIITVHGIKGFKFYDLRFLWIFFKQGLKSADALIAVNIEDKKKLEKEFKKVYYIPNGVDFSVYKEIKSAVQKKIAFIGRIHEQKGIIYLLKAFSELRKKNTDFKLEIIGAENNYSKELKKKFNDRNIIWTGFISSREKIAEKLKSSYCIVLPSLWEGLPLTLFESLASERPVIVSDIKAFKSVAKNEVLFFKSQDSNDLANKINFLINNKKKADEQGKRGEKLAQEYDWKKIAEKLNKLYKEI